MSRIIRFGWEGRNYEVAVERAGDRLTLTYQGKRYVVTLLPEQRRSAGSASRPAPPAPVQGDTAADPGNPVPPAPSAAAVPASTAVPAPVPAPTSVPAAAPAAEIDSAGALHAPMTGVIKEIKVGPGQNVEQGQVILIMEAMKMDIDVPSPESGVVAEVLVRAGDTVSAQQKLLVIH
jgi:biotin carboxyl carrier protein